MKERPILFSGAMVRALLDGRKTQTRRIVSPPPPPRPDGSEGLFPHLGGWRYTDVDYQGDYVETCRYGVPGDRLWVRETIDTTLGCDMSYLADDERLVDAHPEGWDIWRDGRDIPYRLPHGLLPSIFMPRWASRLTLEITDVRVQRLQEISEEDARAEGVEDRPSHGAEVGSLGRAGNWQFRTGYRELWDSINEKRAPWASNPWVWALTFRRLDV